MGGKVYPMAATLDEQTYLSVCRLRGDCRGSACPGLGERIAEWVQGEPLNLLWDFSALEMIDASAFGAIAGSMVVQMVKGQPVIVMIPPPIVRSYLRSCGLDDKVLEADSEDEAIVKLIVELPKRYDSYFFDTLVREGHLCSEDVSTFQEMLKDGSGGDLGLLLLSRRILTPRELLACMVKQKSRLGEILIESGLISESQLRYIVKEQRRSSRKERLGDVLLRMGLASNEEIYEALAEQSKRRRRLESKGDASKRESVLLGEILLEDELLDRHQLDAAVKEQQRSNGELRLGQVLLELGFVDDGDIFNALLKQFKRKRASKIDGGEDRKVRNALDEVVAQLDTEDHMQIHRVRRAVLPMGLVGQRAMLAALRSGDQQIRRNAAWLLGDLGGRRAGGALVDLLKDASQDVVDAAGWSLMRMSRRLIPYTQVGRWISWWANVGREAGDEEVPVVSSDRMELEKVLRQMAEGVIHLDDLILEYQVGLAHWIGGRTNMIIYGSGRVMVVNRFKKEWTFYEGRAAKTQIRQLLKSLLRKSVLKTRTNRKLAVSKESVHDIAVSISRMYRSTTFLWYNEIYQNPGFASFEKELRAILRDLTKGRVW